MQYGICSLNIVPVRSGADDTAEMISQLLYGEHFKILEQRKLWSRIRITFDGFEGWVKNQQICIIEAEQYTTIDNLKNPKIVADLVSFVSNKQGLLLPVVLGSIVEKTPALSNTFEGESIDNQRGKHEFIRTALQYLNAPYLWGGKTPFGIDSAGFTQMVYKINGYHLKRTALAQSRQGDPLSFIEESEPGDLAFFDNKEGEIDHVGIIMKENYIIHAYGKVRIDRLDHTGIFNSETRSYTHSLRVIKKIV